MDKIKYNWITLMKDNLIKQRNRWIGNRWIKLWNGSEAIGNTGTQAYAKCDQQLPDTFE